MGLIDNIAAVPYSKKKLLQTIRPGILPSAEIIEAMKDGLVACGWDLDGSFPAIATINYPLGFPAFSGGSGPCGCGLNWVVISTLTGIFKYCGYAPGQTPVGIGCFQFEYGSSAVASLLNMCAVISATSPYNATLSGTDPNFLVTLQSKALGPFNNFDQVDADGRFGVSNQHSSGGGYRLKSVGNSPYTVTLTGEFGVDLPVAPQVVRCTFEMGPSGQVGTVAYSLLASGISKYTMVANPYSFAVFQGSNVVVHLDGSGNSIAAFAPCVPVAEGFDAAYCVFVLGPGNLTEQLMWKGGPLDAPTSVSLDAAPFTMAERHRGPQALALRAFSFPAVTLNGQSLVTAAYAMLAARRDTTPGVVGKLWDCGVISEPMVLGGSISVGGRKFVCIATQDGTGGNTPASLIFCVDDEGQPTAGDDGSGGSTDTGGAGDGGGTSPSDPTAPAGSGNGSFSGTCTCTGTPNAHTVSWASGQKFDPSMVGQTLTMTLFGLAHPWVSAGGSGDADGTLPVIASVIDPDTLTTTEDLNSSFYGAQFTSP